MPPWHEKGCEICRRQWGTGAPPPELAVDDQRHARLHRCTACGTYWEESEHYADTIGEAEARQRYPGAFS